jgi:uncharacterized protein YukE
MEKDLLRMKKEIDETKTEIAELKGKQNHLQEELKTGWNCASVDEAKEQLKEMEEDMEKLDRQIQKGIEEIEENYNG